MGLLPLPKNPKVDDLVPQLKVFDDRLIALEDYVGRNDRRITTLEARYDQVVAERGQRIAEIEAVVAEHQRGAVDRQREVNRLKQEAVKTRWQLRRRRRR